jgi:hypothetical protein
MAGMDFKTVETTTCNDFKKLIVFKTRRDLIALTALNNLNRRKIFVFTFKEDAKIMGKIHDIIDVMTTMKSNHI